MSVRIMSLVWEMELPDSEKIVLLALADCANDEGHCWPGMPSLVKKCCKSDRTIQAAIRTLCAKGHLTRREVVGKGCNYTVHPIVRFASPRTGFAPEAASPPKPLAQTPEAVSGKPSRTVNSASNEAGASADPVKALVDLGVDVLTSTGTPERQARSLIGKWRKAKGDGEVLTALIDCRARAIAQPVEWLEKRFGGVRYVSPSGHEYKGDDRAVMREAEKRADWGTYYTAKRNLEERAA